MALDELYQLVEQFEKLAQVSPAVPLPPGGGAEKAAKDTEMRARVKEIKLLADTIEKKYLALKNVPGFVGNFSIQRDVAKAKSWLEDALKAIEKS